nr:unnamed protein product [Callosobruchus analis]
MHETVGEVDNLHSRLTHGFWELYQRNFIFEAIYDRDDRNLISSMNDTPLRWTVVAVLFFQSIVHNDKFAGLFPIINSRLCVLGDFNIPDKIWCNDDFGIQVNCQEKSVKLISSKKLAHKKYKSTGALEDYIKEKDSQLAMNGYAAYWSNLSIGTSFLSVAIICC